MNLTAHDASCRNGNLITNIIIKLMDNTYIESMKAHIAQLESELVASLTY